MAESHVIPIYLSKNTEISGSGRRDKEPMKILQVTPFYEGAWSMGGIVLSTSLMSRSLVAMGHDVTVYTTNSDGSGWLDVPINCAVDIGGVKVHYFYTPTPKTFYYSRALAKACHESLSTFDLIHTASLWNYFGIVVGAQARKQSVPYVFETDGALQEGELKRSRVKKLAFRKLFEMRNLQGAAAIRYVSEVERKQTAHLELQTPNFLLPSGLDLGEFDHLPNRNEARLQLQLDPDNLVVGYIGRLHIRKGIDFLIRGFSRIVDSFPRAVLLVGGSDHGDKSRLQALVQQLDLKQHVRFLGYVGPDERAALLSSADVMTLISLEGECFGNAAVEAMAAGVPVLVSKHVGVSRVIESEGAGRIVDVNDVAIATDLTALLSDSALRNEMRKNGYRSARKHYDIKNIAKLLMLAYEDILTGRRSPELYWSNGMDS